MSQKRKITVPGTPITDIFPKKMQVFVSSKNELWNLYIDNRSFRGERIDFQFCYHGGVFWIPALKCSLYGNKIVFFILNADYQVMRQNLALHTDSQYHNFKSQVLRPAALMDTRELSGERIAILNNHDFTKLFFMLDQYYLEIRGAHIPVQKRWDGKLCIRQSVWDNLSSYVKDRFKKLQSKKSTTKKAKREIVAVNISDPGRICIILQMGNIRSICSENVVFTDGCCQWIVPCRSRGSNIQVPIDAFMKSVPESAVNTLLRNSSLSDPLHLLPKGYFKETQEKRDPPNSETASNNGVAASYFSEDFINHIEQQSPKVWNLWQQSRQIFIFEESLSRSLLSNADTVESVPCEILSCSPFSACYIVGVEQNGARLEFFTVMLDSTLILQRIENNQVVEIYTINLLANCAVKDTLPAIADANQRKSIMEMLQLYAGLCSAELDTSPVSTGFTSVQKQPNSPMPPTLTPAQNTSIYTVKMQHRVSTRQRTIKTGSKRVAGRPHKRRAHWHHFWIGSRSDPESRRLVAKWLPEISVNAADADIPVRIVIVSQSNCPSLT